MVDYSAMSIEEAAKLIADGYKQLGEFPVDMRAGIRLQIEEITAEKTSVINEEMELTGDLDSSDSDADTALSDESDFDAISDEEPTGDASNE